MATVNPVQSFLSTYVASGASGQSLYVTFSFAITANFEAQIPVLMVTPAGVTAGAEVYVFRTADGGATYETELSIAGVFSRSGSATQRKDINVTTGQYLVSVLVGGGSSATWSVGLGTAWVITAYA